MIRWPFAILGLGNGVVNAIYEATKSDGVIVRNEWRRREGNVQIVLEASKEIGMRNKFKSSVTSALCIALAATASAGNAWAGPNNIASSGIINAPSLTEQVHYRRYHRRHYVRYYRRGYDPSGALFGAVAAGLIGAAAANAYQPRYYYGYPAYGYPVYGYPAYGYPYYGGW